MEQNILVTAEEINLYHAATKWFQSRLQAQQQSEAYRSLNQPFKQRLMDTERQCGTTLDLLTQIQTNDLKQTRQASA